MVQFLWFCLLMGFYSHRAPSSFSTVQRYFPARFCPHSLLSQQLMQDVRCLLQTFLLLQCWCERLDHEAESTKCVGRVLKKSQGTLLPLMCMVASKILAHVCKKPLRHELGKLPSSCSAGLAHSRQELSFLVLLRVNP